MGKSRCIQKLKATGIDDKTAAPVQASLNGEHYATKSDLLTMQRLMYEQHEKMMNGFTNLKTEIGGMHRQYWITFGGLTITIISVFAVNWYYQLVNRSHGPPWERIPEHAPTEEHWSKYKSDFIRAAKSERRKKTRSHAGAWERVIPSFAAAT